MRIIVVLNILCSFFSLLCFVFTIPQKGTTRLPFTAEISSKSRWISFFSLEYNGSNKKIRTKCVILKEITGLDNKYKINNIERLY